MGGEGELQKRLREFIRKECDACMEIGKLDKPTKHWERTHGTVYRSEELLTIVEEAKKEILENNIILNDELMVIKRNKVWKWFGGESQK